MDSQLCSPLPSPHKEPGEARPDPGKAHSSVFHPREPGPGSPPPAGSLRQGRRSGGGEPGTRPVLLTSARAGSGPCTAAGCCCSCWAGAGGSLFRWLRSSSGTARTPAGAHSSGNSRSRSSRGADARPLPRAAAAIPPSETAAHGRLKRKCGRLEASTPSRPRARPPRLAATFQGGACSMREVARADVRLRSGRRPWPATRTLLAHGGHTTPRTVSAQPGPIPPGSAPDCDGLPLARRPPRRRDVLGQVEVRLAPSSYWTRRSRGTGRCVTFLASHPSRAPPGTRFPSVCPPSQNRTALYFLFPPESFALISSPACLLAFPRCQISSNALATWQLREPPLLSRVPHSFTDSRCRLRPGDLLRTMGLERQDAII